MTQSRPTQLTPAQEAAQTEALVHASIGGGSTADMMTFLARSSANIPSTIPNSDRIVKDITISEAKARQLEKAVSTEGETDFGEATPLETDLIVVKRSLEELGKDRGNTWYNDFAANYGTLNAEVASMRTQRGNLTKQIGDYLSEKNETFQKVNEGKLAGQSNDTLRKTLSKLGGNGEALTTQLDSLSDKEKLLSEKLRLLHMQIYNAIPSTKREGITAPAGLQEGSEGRQRLR